MVAETDARWTYVKWGKKRTCFILHVNDRWRQRARRIKKTKLSRLKHNAVQLLQLLLLIMFEHSQTMCGNFSSQFSCFIFPFLVRRWSRWALCTAGVRIASRSSAGTRWSNLFFHTTMRTCIGTTGRFSHAGRVSINWILIIEIDAWNSSARYTFDIPPLRVHCVRCCSDRVSHWLMSLSTESAVAY